MEAKICAKYRNITTLCFRLNNSNNYLLWHFRVVKTTETNDDYCIFRRTQYSRTKKETFQGPTESLMVHGDVHIIRQGESHLRSFLASQLNGHKAYGTSRVAFRITFRLAASSCPERLGRVTILPHLQA